MGMVGRQSLVESVLASAQKSGYNFTLGTTQVLAGPPAQFFAYALPVTQSGVGQTGTRRFAIAEDGVLRGDTSLSTAPADRAAVGAMAALGNSGKPTPAVLFLRTAGVALSPCP